MTATLAIAPGCSTVDSKGSDVVETVVESQALETLTVYGALKAIEKASEPVEKARRIRDVVVQVKSALDSESVRGAVLERLVQELVAGRDLSPADRYLVSKTAPILNKYVGDDGFIVGEKKAALQEFLNDLISATQFYVE